MMPEPEAYNPDAPIHLLQTGFVSQEGLDDMSLASATAKGIEQYELNAMNQNREMKNVSIWSKKLYLFIKIDNCTFI